MEKILKGIKNPGLAANHVLAWPALMLSSRGLLGTNVFSTNFDLVILLDTCRVDALRIVSEEYDFINKVESRISVGGTSGEWIAATFDKRHSAKIKQTAYLAANGYAKVILEEEGRGEFDDMNVHVDSRFHSRLMDWDTVDASELGRLEHLWRYESKGEEGRYGHVEGHSPPRYVTDRGITVDRTYDFDTIILHYNQPHSPYTSNALREQRSLKQYESDPGEYIKRTGDKQTVFDSYLDDLRSVLDEVETLLQNIDRENVLITADHGEAFGEFGVFGHAWGSLHPHVRRVPWVKTSAEDTGEYSPESIDESTPERTVEETLKALGYV
ncbi:alkaline phosphatase family protein [Halostella salina]|uniref:hypothetical protein n=1 Tax=Halostella salina TaxID=1547897 RepID=UPI0013CEDD74|nr:hypothetical protein [Halostella salina]